MSFPSIDDQNIYQGTILKLVAANTINLVLDSHVTELYGDEYTPCTIDARHTLQSVDIQKNSQLKRIQYFAFYNCEKLLSIDLSACNELIDISDKAFYQCSLLKTVLLPTGKKLKAIGIACFNKDVKLEKITIPATVEAIGMHCFMSCDAMTELILETGSLVSFLPKWTLSGTKVTEFQITKKIIALEAGTFEGASLLQKIYVEQGNPSFRELLDGVASFDNKTIMAFPAGKTGPIEIPSGVKNIFDIAFSGTKLAVIKFPDTLNTIGNYAFSGASNLKQINIPDSVTSIGGYAFWGCYNCESLKLSKNISKISFYSFYGCGFSTVEIPNSVTILEDNCFAECNKLTRIVLPETIQSLGGNVFPSKDNLDISFPEGSNMKWNKDLMLITDVNSTVINQYMGRQENFVFSVESSFTEIKNHAFNQKPNLIEVVFLPESNMKTIGTKAFYGCTNLNKITFPESLETIKDQAFQGCSGLTDLKFGSKLNKIGKECFYGCKRVLHLDMSKTKVEIIEESTFRDCTALLTAKIPATVTNFSEYCFLMCTSLTDFELATEAKIAKIGDKAFMNTKIKSFSLNEGSTVTEIGGYAFAYCTNLASFTFCTSVTTIKSYAFAFSGLESVVLTEGIATLGDRCFINCESITKLEIPEKSTLTVDKFGFGAFGNCYLLDTIICKSSNFEVSFGALFSPDLTNLILFPPASSIAFFPIPEYVQTISNSAFLGCKNLYSVIMPSNATKYLGNSAFEGCINLHYINIPDTLTYIGTDAFKGCVSLSCGVDLRNESLTEQLINVAKLPRMALHKCGKLTVPRCSRNVFPFIQLFFTLLSLTD